MARTMTDEQEREIRLIVKIFDETRDDSHEAALLAELDAERSAHEETKGAWLHDIAAHELAANDEITALNARLALAEAVCEAGDAVRQMQPLPYALVEALAAWRAAK